MDKITAFFTRTGVGPFEKWKVDAALRDKIFAKPQKVDATVLQAAEDIFKRVNAILSA